MRKILVFLLILASFSCATLDSNVKENSNVEKNEKVEEPKREDSVAGIEKNIATNKHEELVKPKEGIDPTKERLDTATIRKDEEKIPVNSNVAEVKDEKKESEKEEKTDTKEKKISDKETLQKNNKKESVPSINVESRKAKEEVKSTIADERALQDCGDFFFASGKVEPKKEEKEEEKKVLPYLEILKELEEAIGFFKKAQPSVATKQRVEKKEKDVSAERVEKEQPEEPKKGGEEVEHITDVATKDESSSSDFSTMDNFNDEEPMLSFEDDSFLIFNNDDEMPYNFDDENLLTFDDGQQAFSFEDEKKDEMINKQNADNKGQLSSVVDEEDKVNISRYTNIIKGQNIDFSYPGEGWVYLGEENSQKGLNYIKRKMGDGKTIFTFTAENMGNYVLNFSYFDVFSGDFIVDAVSVKVMPNDDGVQKDSLVLEYQGKDVKKPNDKKIKKTPNDVNVDADKVGINTDGAIKEEENSKKQSSKTTSIEGNMEIVKPAVSKDKNNDSAYKEPEVFTNIANINPSNAKTKVTGEDARKMIDEVSKEISNGNAKRALERLDDFFVVASTNMDEAYFLRGKAYELNTEQKNIKMALAAYKFLTKTFPDSPFWSEADARIRYIEKFFVKIK